MLFTVGEYTCFYKSTTNIFKLCRAFLTDGNFNARLASTSSSQWLPGRWGGKYDIPGRKIGETPRGGKMPGNLDTCGIWTHSGVNLLITSHTTNTLPPCPKKFIWQHPVNSTKFRRDERTDRHHDHYIPPALQRYNNKCKRGRNSFHIMDVYVYTFHKVFFKKKKAK